METTTLAETQLAYLFETQTSDAVKFLEDMIQRFLKKLDMKASDDIFRFTPPANHAPVYFEIATLYFKSEGFRIDWMSGAYVIQLFPLDDFVDSGPDSIYSRFRKRQDDFVIAEKLNREAVAALRNLDEQRALEKREALFQETLTKFDKLMADRFHLDLKKCSFDFLVPHFVMCSVDCRERFLAHIQKLGFEIRNESKRVDGKCVWVTIHFTCYETKSKAFAEGVFQAVKKARVEGLVSE